MSDSQTPHNDPIMDALGRANPVSPAQIPTAQSDAAQALLQQVTSRPAGGGFDSYTAPIAFEKPEKVDAPGRYRFLAAVAVAIAVVAASVSFMLPSNSQTALALVQTAADETQKAISGHVTTTLSFEGSDAVESGQIEGSIDVLFDVNDLAVSVNSISSDGLEEGDIDDLAELEELELRYVDDVAYIYADGEWTGIDAPGFISEMVIAEYANPTMVLDEVQSLTDVTEVGSETINGISTTHYQSEINLAEGEVFNAKGWLGQVANELALEADGIVMIDLYVGDDGLLRLMNVTADLEPSDSTIEGDASIVISTEFDNLNGDIDIEAPEGVEIMDLGDLGAEFGDELEEEFDN